MFRSGLLGAASTPPGVELADKEDHRHRACRMNADVAVTLQCQVCCAECCGAERHVGSNTLPQCPAT